MSVTDIERTRGPTSRSELQADTEAGVELVIVATGARPVRRRRMVHDRDGTFATEHLDELVAIRVPVGPHAT